MHTRHLQTYMILFVVLSFCNSMFSFFVTFVFSPLKLTGFTNPRRQTRMFCKNGLGTYLITTLCGVQDK